MKREKLNPSIQIILFLVEGPSDRTYLQRLKEEIEKQTSQRIIFKIVHEDLLSCSYYGKDNVKCAIVRSINKQMMESKIKKDEILEVVQVTDTDGIYIEDCDILSDSSIPRNKTNYERDKILNLNRDNIIKRNKIKRNNVQQLLDTSKIMNYPYRLYFVSCNSDDFFMNKQNISQEEKKEASYQFYEEFDFQSFFEIFFDSKNAMGEDFRTTWTFIQEKNNSLARYSNLYLFIEKWIKIER